MHKELKKQILNFIFENDKEFNLTNATIAHFRLYIYDNDGNYLIGGEIVSKFIKNAIELVIN